MGTPELRRINRKYSLSEKIHTLSVDSGDYGDIDFSDINKHVQKFADTIESRREELVDILLTYESHEVAEDEIARTLDLLRNLKENEKYFRVKVGSVATFLPRNQPLYALTCFVIVPSLMTRDVHFRIPHSMHGFLPKVLKLLDIKKTFANIHISTKERLEFLKERSVLMVNPTTGQKKPLTEAVIFTGTSTHADQLRHVFDKSTLFISNGSGHNPLVIGQKANIVKAVEATLTLSLYNQGQDCAAPNSILVHQDVYDKFMKEFHKEFSKIKIGPYHDRSCRVGPISDPNDLRGIASIIVNNREWLDPKTPGIIRVQDGIIEPTVVLKSLEIGGNYQESFAPIIFIQKYKKDSDLGGYFEHPHYAHNAMYVTLYGQSTYIKNLIGREISGKVLHKSDTFLHNIHLHEVGVERGTQPYGGYGYAASSVSFNGKVIPKPTLPQRDIYEWLARPLVNLKSKPSLKEFTGTEYKNVEKLLRLHISKTDSENEQSKLEAVSYFDLKSLSKKDARYSKIDERNIYHLIADPYKEYIAALGKDDRILIRNLKKLLEKRSTLSTDEFTTQLYSLPKDIHVTEEDNKNRQLNFFRHVYQLLFRKDSGPRLGSFLVEVDLSTIEGHLDV